MFLQYLPHKNTTMSSFIKNKTADFDEQAHCGLNRVITVPSELCGVEWPVVSAIVNVLDSKNVGESVFIYWKCVLEYNDFLGNSISSSDAQIFTFLVGLVGSGVSFNEFSLQRRSVAEMPSSNKQEVAGVREQAHGGKRSVATSPRIQVDREGVKVGPLALVYPKKEKISWFQRKLNPIDKPMVHDTSKKQYWVKPKRPADRYVVQQYMPRPVVPRTTFNPNVNKGVKGVRLPSNPLPPSKPYVERPPIDNTGELRDAFQGLHVGWEVEDVDWEQAGDEEDPEVQAEKEYARDRRREFLKTKEPEVPKYIREQQEYLLEKAKPVAQMDTKLPKIHKRTLTPVLGANSLRHKFGSITKLTPPPPTYEAATLYPNLAEVLPMQSTAVKYEEALESLKELSVDEDYKMLDQVREGKPYVTKRPQSVDFYKPNFEGWVLRVNRNVPPRFLPYEAQKCPLPVIYVEIPSCSFTKLFSVLRAHGYDFSHYYDIIRNKRYAFEKVCTFVDVYVLFDVLKRAGQGCVIPETEVLAMCMEIPRALVAICDEIRFFYQHHFGAPLTVALEEYKPKAQSDPAVFVEEQQPQTSGNQPSFITSVMELPGTINVAARQVSDAAQVIPTIANRVNEVLDRATLAVDDLGQKWNEAMKCAEFLRLLVDAKIQYDYILSNPYAPVSVKLFKTIDLGLRAFAVFRPGLSFSDVVNVLATTEEGEIVHTHDVLVRPVAQTGAAMCLSHFVTALYEAFSPDKGSYAYMMLEYCRKFNVFSTTLSKTEFCFKTIIEWLGKVLETISCWTGTNSLLAWFNRVSGRTIDRFIELAMTYLATLDEEVGSDPEIDAVLLNLLEQKKEVERLIAVNGWTPQLLRMRDIFKKLDERKMLYDMRKEDVDGRLTPYCVCIYGPPQIGKSQLLTTFADVLLPEVPLGMRVYARGQSEFYDGYNGQQSILVDDWAARADADFGELLDWVTCNKTVLPMASLDNRAIGAKGTLLKAKLILLSTNTPFPNVSVTMLNPEAVYARRHALIECIKVKEFVLEDPKFSHLNFKIHDPVNPSKPPSGVMDYDQLIAYLTKKYGEHMAVQMKLQEHRRARRSLLAPKAQMLGLSSFGLACTGAGVGFATAMSSIANAGYLYSWGVVSPKWIGAAFLGAFVAYISTRAAVASRCYADLDVFCARNSISDFKKKRILGILNANDEIDTKSILDKAVYYLSDVKTSNVAQVCGFYQQNRKRDELRSILSEIYRKYELDKFGVESDVDAERYDAKLPKMIKQPVVSERYDTKPPKLVKAPIRAEATEDVAALDLVTNLIRARMCRISVWNKTGDPIGTVNGLAIKGTCILTTKHVFYDTTRAEMVATGTVRAQFGVETATWFQAPLTYQVEFGDGNVRFGKGDYCVIDFGGVMNQYKDVTHHFIKEEDLSLLSEFDAQLVTKSPNFSAIETVVRPLTHPKTYTVGPGEMRIQSGWEYRANTSAGDCGAPIVAYKSCLPRKITGIHVCAYQNSSKAYGETITQEKLRELLEPIAQSAHFEYVDFGLEKACYTIPELEIIGRVGIKEGVHQPTDTKLVPSVFSGHFGCVKSPAILHDNDPRSPLSKNILENNFMKYAKPCYGYSGKTMSEVSTALIEWIKSIDPFYPRKVLSNVETVNGFDCLSRLDPHTSAGYPYCLPQNKGSTSGKLAYMHFDEKEDKYTIDDKIWHEVETRWILSHMYTIPKSIWVACLKDELLSPEKIAKAKTRVFVTAPLDFTLSVRKYFGAFSSWVMKNGMKLGIAVGFNPESMKWSEIYNTLRAKGDRRVGELDYTEFDSTLSPCLARAFVDVVNAWYGGSEAENRFREALVFEMMRTNVLIKRDVVQKNHGNPSGNPLTTIFNSFCSIMLLMLYFRRSAEEKFRDYSFFFRKVAFFVCGDDNIFAYEGDYCKEERLNDSIRMVAQELGMTVTDATKDADTFQKDLEDATFLKRGFRVEGNYALPTLALKSINAMLEWVTKSKYSTIEESSEVNAETALRYLYFHGRTVFDEYRNKMLEVASAKGMYMVLPTYAFYDQTFRENGELDMGNTWC